MSHSKDAWAFHPEVPLGELSRELSAPVGLFEAATRRFAVVDTETTGLQRDARIVELAAAWVDVATGAVSDLRTMLVNPGIPIPREVTAIHGIRDRDVKGKPSIDRVLTPFFAFLEDGPVVAHNAAFDIRRLRFEAERTRSRIPGRVPVWCSMKVAKKAFPGRTTYRLEALAADLSLPREGAAHRAASDIRVTARLVLRAMAEAKKDLRELTPQEDTL